MKTKIIALALILLLSSSLAGCLFVPSATPPEDVGDLGGEGDSGDHDDSPEPEQPVLPTPDGYTFPTVKDVRVYSVESTEEASRRIDIGIAGHLSELVIDFSALGEDFNPMTDFECKREFTSHVWLKYTQSEESPSLLKININYRATTASKTASLTEENTYSQIASANYLLNTLLVPESERRPASLNLFPIDTVARPIFRVYNSEELWWAVEQGYRPVFPVEDSSAERIYEQARAVLRRIISKNMTDFQKLSAIYEYVVHNVRYDHDAVANKETIPAYENTGYFLEGVFDYGRAVCDGKSKAFVLLCGIEGIRALRDYGYGEEGSAGHAWNYVLLDGEWYLVDTTNGDVSVAMPNAIASFYERNVEIIEYNYFLNRLSLFEGKYTYSGVFADLLEDCEPKSRSADLLTLSRVDFIMDGPAELADCISRVTDAGYSEFVIVVGLAPAFSEEFGANDYSVIMNGALEILGIDRDCEWRAWIQNLGGENRYMYTLRAAAE